MGPCPYVAAQVDPPKLRSIQLITIQINITRMTRQRVVLGIGGVPLHNDFVFPVAIHVPHTAIVRGIGVSHAFIVNSTGGLVEVEGPIGIRPNRCDLSRSRLLHSAHNRANRVNGRGRTCGIGIVGNRNGAGIDLGSVTINIEGGRRCIGAQNAPTQKNIRAAGINPHQTPAQILHIRRRPQTRTNHRKQGKSVETAYSLSSHKVLHGCNRFQDTQPRQNFLRVG